MTVQELRAILDKCPADAEVRLDSGKPVENPSLVYAPFVYVGEYALIIK